MSEDAGHQDGSYGDPSGTDSGQAGVGMDQFLAEAGDSPDFYAGQGQVLPGLEDAHGNMNKHFQKRVQQAVAAKRAYEERKQELDLYKEDAETFRELQRSPEFYDFYNRLRDGEYAIGVTGNPNMQSNPNGNGQDQPQGDPWDFDPVTAEPNQLKNAVAHTVKELIAEELLPVMKPLAEREYARSEREKMTELERVRSTYPDFDQHADKIRATMDRYGIPVEDAYRMHGNRLNADQTAKLRQQQQASPGGYGPPAMKREKAKSMDDALRLIRQERRDGLLPQTMGVDNDSLSPLQG